MFDINAMLFYGLRAVGKGSETAKTLCCVDFTISTKYYDKLTYCTPLLRMYVFSPEAVEEPV